MGTAVVIAASNRAAAGVYEDKTGPVIVAWLRSRGFEVGDPVAEPKDSRDALEHGPDQPVGERRRVDAGADPRSRSQRPAPGRRGQ